MPEEKIDVLVVDDEEIVRELVTSSLTTLNYRCEGAANAQEAEAKLAENPFPLVFLDIRLPGVSGLDLLPRIKERYPDTMVIMLTGFSDLNVAVKAMKLGAEDYIAKPFNIEHLLLAAERALEKRELLIEHRDYEQRLEEMVKEQTKEIAQQRDTIARLYRDTIEVLAAAIEAKDLYTEGHSKRVAIYGLQIAQEIGFTPEQIREMEIGGLMHDIGKIGTPETVLTKTSGLTLEDFTELQKHPVLGSAIVSKIKGISDIVIACIRHHHERWDGRGYPDKLAGEEIPLPGRILALADAFDEMTSSRSYRSAILISRGLEEVKKNAGKRFDPELVQIWLNLIDRLRSRQQSQPYQLKIED